MAAPKDPILVDDPVDEAEDAASATERIDHEDVLIEDPDGDVEDDEDLGEDVDLGG